MTRRRPLDCQHLVELLTRYLDGVLTPALHESVEDHLRRCDDCAAHLHQLRLVIALAGTLGPQVVVAQDAGGAGPAADLLEVFRRNAGGGPAVGRWAP